MTCVYIFKLDDCLLGRSKLTNNAYLDKYGYSSYSFEFDSRSSFSLPNGEVGKNAFIFDACICSLRHIDTRR